MSSATDSPTTQTSPASMPPSVFTLPHTAQLEALYTIIRDKNTSRGDFLFYSDRIIRLLVEEGLNHLPVVSKTVETPTVCGQDVSRFNFATAKSAISGSFLWRSRIWRENLWCINSTGRGSKLWHICQNYWILCWPLLNQAMEAGLREVCRSVRIGKILIQRVCIT